MTAWPSFPLGDVCRTTSGGTPSRKRADYFQGDIPWVKSGELTDGLVSEVSEFITEEAVANSSAKLFPQGTLLIAMYGATVGKLGVLAKSAATNQAVCAIFPPPELDLKFLFWFLRFKRSYLIDQAVGGAQPNISQSILRELMVPVPPIGVQREAVAEIEKQFSRLDEAVANLQRVKANLKRYKASVLKAAVEGRLVETEASIAQREGRSYETGEQLLQRILEERRAQWAGKGKYKEPELPVLDGLNSLPEGWAYATTEQMCEQIASGSTPSPDAMFSGAGDVPFLKVYNLTFDGSLDFTVKPTYVADTTHQSLLARSRSIPGDVLMNIVGPPLGKVSIIPSIFPEWNINQAIVTFRTSPRLVNRLLAHWLLAQPVLSRLERTAKATAGQHNLQVSTCRKLPIPVPPITEQVRIVAEVDRHLSIVREVEAEVDANLQRAWGLRQSTLFKLFQS
jgi:type I restriction enzyme S subunit